MAKQNKIINTELALKVSCKCGGCVGATMLVGGVAIDSEFMDTLAKYANNGGKVEIININQRKITISGCCCASE